MATDSEAYEERRYEELHKLVAKGKLMMDKEVLPPMLRVFAYMCLPALKKALDAVAEEVGDVKVVCDEVFQPAAQRLERVQCDEYVIYVYGRKVFSVGGSFAARWARMVLKRCSSERGEREKRFYRDGKGERRRTAF